MGWRMSGKEFGDWIAYHRLEPWGTGPADLRAGIVAATIANCHRGKNTPPFKAGDFMPKYEPDPAPEEISPLEFFRSF